MNQRVIHVEASRKRSLLAELLANPEMSRTLVFTRTKRGADRVARHLETGGTKVAAIHGNKSQRQRENALEDFRASRISVLVATDIAARGIDIDLVSHVVNYELPRGAGGLRAPHWTHRPRRRIGHRHLALWMAPSAISCAPSSGSRASRSRARIAATMRALPPTSHRLPQAMTATTIVAPAVSAPAVDRATHRGRPPGRRRTP